jgi:hypothetical protein
VLLLPLGFVRRLILVLPFIMISPRKYISAFKKKDGLEGDSNKLMLSRLLH